MARSIGEPRDSGRVSRRVSLREAAEYIGVHERTMRRWVAQGRLTAYRYGSNTIRVDVDDVLALGHEIPTGNFAR